MAKPKECKHCDKPIVKANAWDDKLGDYGVGNGKYYVHMATGIRICSLDPPLAEPK